MVYVIGCINGLNGNWGSPAAANEVGDIEIGSGSPNAAHASPIQTLYVRVDATPGTSSVFRNTDGSVAWTANSDD